MPVVHAYLLWYNLLSGSTVFEVFSGETLMQGNAMAQQLSKAELHEVERHRVRMSSESGRDVSFDESLENWLKTQAQRWREERQARLLLKQREEILRHKWIESEKAQRDLGAEAALDWIRRYAAQWRKWYEDQHDLAES
jgi:hypothetical protein